MTESYDEECMRIFGYQRETYRHAKEMLIQEAGKPTDMETLVCFLCREMSVNIFGSFPSHDHRWDYLANMAVYLQPAMITMIDEGYMVHYEPGTDPPLKRGSLSERFKAGDSAVGESITALCIWGYPPQMKLVIQPFHYEDNKLVFSDESGTVTPPAGDMPDILSFAFSIGCRSIQNNIIDQETKLKMLDLDRQVLRGFLIAHNLNPGS